MPYIPKAYRDELDIHVDRLSHDINYISKQIKEPWASAGMLNYVVSRLLVRTLPEKKYWALALGVGTLVCAILEFYRRFAGPYEDEAIIRNGDIEEYQ